MLARLQHLLTRRLCFGLAVVLGLMVSGLWYSLTQPGTEELFEQGVAAISRGDIAEGERIARRMTTHPDAASYSHVLNGGLMMQSGLYRDALLELAPDLATGKRREPILVWAGECLLNLRDLARAELTLRTATEELPDNHQAVRLLAVVYYDLGSMHPALNQLKKLQQFDPHDYRPYRTSGTIYLDFEQFDEAITDLRAALDRSPPQPIRDAIALDLAHGLRRLLKFSDALAIAATVRPSARRSAELALAHLGTGNLEAATFEVQEGRQLDMNEPLLFRAEAQVQIEHKQFAKALSTLRKLTQLEPQDVEAHYKLAFVLKELGRTDEHTAALDRFNKIMSLRNRLTELNAQANKNPYNAALRLELADVCRQLGRLDLERDWRNAADACREFEQVWAPQRKPDSK